MKLEYQIYHYRFQFENPIVFHSLPTFIFRNILGMHLKKLNCIFPRISCAECSLQNQCAYSMIFETPIDKENPYLKGRNRAPHPFILYSSSAVGQSLIKLELDLILIGKAIRYFPYLHYALVRGGENGLFKERRRYTVIDVISNGESLLLERDNLSIPKENRTWQLSENLEPAEKQNLRIELKTPLRVKREGRFYSRIGIDDILDLGFQRLKLLIEFYGEMEGTYASVDWNPYHEHSRDLRWVDYSRYSSRQRHSMKLGGVVGTINADVEFSPFEWSILKGAEIFHLGKNTGFGLGKIEVKREER